MKIPLRLSLAVLSLSLLLAACHSAPDRPQPTLTATLTPQATTTLTPQQLVGRPVKGRGAAVYRLMEDSQIRHIQDWATFLALGYLPGDIVLLADQDLAVWRDGALWIVDETGQLARWGGQAWQSTSAAARLLARLLTAARRTLAPTITAWALDPAAGVGWWATGYNGLWQIDLKTGQRTNFTTFNSDLPDDHVTDLALGPNETLWLTTPSRLVKVLDGTFKVVSEKVPSSSFARAADGTIWLAGDNEIGSSQGPIYRAYDHPLLLDHFDVVTLDTAGMPWFIGRRHLIHFNGQTWTAYDRQTGAAAVFTPGQPEITPVPALPAPTADYTGWLQTWPRPEGDNGRCIHYLQYPAGDDFEVWEQITRLEHLGMRWVLVNYTSQEQLWQMAPLFARAGLMVIWRPFVRPYQTYAHWGEDVRFLRALGLVPYIQVYNEPSLSAEWDGQAVDQAVYLDHLVDAVRQVYDAGGYAGVQQIDLDWTRAMLQRLKTDHLDETFDRLFFVPHPYGANHPPDYDHDLTSVVGFEEYAKVFEQEIGFVPVMIAGEGGWRFGDQADARYPAITAEVLRDYNVALFDWFRTGQLSNGDPLPDYLFAFCPWLLSDPFDPAGWYDSTAGDHTLLIEGIVAMPGFTRKFSWER